jgi:exosortase A
MTLNPAQTPAALTLERARALSRNWLFAAALVLSAIFWLLAWYWDTARSIVTIWERSETFTHGFLIVPISAWLIWRQRHNLAALSPQPNFLVLALTALVGFGWLLGQLAGTAVIQQYGLVFMIPLMVWTILGTQVAWLLVFPLLFLLFAVPFGEFLLPSLMQQTADVLIFALRLTGIPVYREGQFFTIPSGNWSVVEACSGLRYLIASVTIGFLYAYLTYRSLTRRVIFVVVSAIVPIIANWLRAYMIVMIGHLSGMKHAVGVDHLIYGWVFFGVVMLVLFGIGSIWREDTAPHTATLRYAALTRQDRFPLKGVMIATIAMAVTVAVWPVVAARMEGVGPYPSPALEAPPSTENWQRMAGRLTDWKPHFSNPQAKIDQVYGRASGHVGLYIGYYRNQRQGVQLISSQNTLVPSNKDSKWINAGESQHSVVVDNKKIPLIEAQLFDQSTRLLVWRWYYVDGRYTINPYWAKLLQAKSKLFGDGDDAAVVIVYTQFDLSREEAALRLREFTDAMLSGITKSLDHAR